MNLHYYNRYTKFLRNIQKRGSPIGPLHNHHIIPRSMGGSNDKDNLIELSIREHFISHWMLAKTYESGKMWLAFRIMCSRFKDCSKITSKMYAISEIKRIENVIGLLDNKVWINGQWISSDEYQSNKEKYKHFNTGTITVRDKNTGKTSKQLINFDKSKYESIKTGMVNAYDRLTGKFLEITKEEFKNGRDRYNSANLGFVDCIEILTGNCIRVTKEEFKIHKNVKYKRKDSGLNLECPHCNKVGGASMRRWHFNNCKQKKEKRG